MSLVLSIAQATLDVFLLAAPFLLFGLLMAGLLHVLIPASVIARFLGGGGLGGIARAALLGTPLPVCSCGVVPMTVELRRKGASEASSLSFLITTPESSADSILLTWGLLGPLMAVVRPLAAFGTALLGGLTGTLLFDDSGHRGVTQGEGCCGEDCNEAGGEESTPRAIEALRRAFSFGHEASETERDLRGSGRPPGADPPPGASRPSLWTDVLRPALRYGFVELLDDLAFWLVLGLVIAGILTAVLPADLGARGLGTGLLPMVLVLVVAVPLYLCASASTPIAAALMAKGLSAGTALVLLLAGPATNAATVVPIARTFGRRFVQVYLGAVVVGSLAAGLAFDAFLGLLGWSIVPRLSPDASPIPGVLAWGASLVLFALLAWRLVAGGWRQGLRELRESFSVR